MSKAVSELPAEKQLLEVRLYGVDEAGDAKDIKGGRLLLAEASIALAKLEKLEDKVC